LVQKLSKWKRLTMIFFSLEHAGELCIINIKKKKGKNPYKPHTHPKTLLQSHLCQETTGIRL
jgi:hypothetical protein